jgi:hypothetical protein
VAEAYFEGQNRYFLSLSEAYEFTRADALGDSGLKVEYQNNASDFFGFCAETKEARRRVAHGFSILRWAEGAVKLRRGEEQSP